MVYLEAQSQGLPVIAYESLGVPLVVDHGATGLLAAESDVAHIREHLLQLIHDPDQAAEMGSIARERVYRQHSIHAAALRLNEILAEF